MDFDEEMNLLFGFHAESPWGMVEALEQRLKRGDFPRARDRLRARWHLWRARRRARNFVALSHDERQSRAAEHAARAAYLAVGVSLFSLVLSVLAYIKPPAPPEQQAALPTLAAPAAGTWSAAASAAASRR